MRTFPTLAAVALAATLALSACTPAAAPAPASTPVAVTAPTAAPAPAPAPAPCEEDEPCWDCKTMGNHTCNITSDAMATDAWATFDKFDFAPAVPTKVEYSRTLDNDSFTLPADEFALESINTPNVWHIFHTTVAPAPAPAPAVVAPAPAPAPVVAAPAAPVAPAKAVKAQTPAPAPAKPAAAKPAPVKAAPAPVATPAPAPRCEEDQPCWNCKTMGNHQCGTAQPAGPADGSTDNVVTPVAKPADPSSAAVLKDAAAAYNLYAETIVPKVNGFHGDYVQTVISNTRPVVSKDFIAVHSTDYAPVVMWHIFKTYGHVCGAACGL